ncbi:Uncharacterised protein [Mycobacteroides abscessus subsp. abscessus]|nr:Uncharacterised protein [Mycobacteroides abscessus subsp. abscessus]
MRHDGGVPRSGPEVEDVGLGDGLDGLVASGRVRGVEPHGFDMAAGRGEHRLAADDLEGAGELDVGLDRQRHRRHRQHPAVGAQELGHPVESGDVVAVDLPQGGDEEVADGMAVEFAVGIEAVLDDVAPGPPPVAVVAEGGQSHPQVAGRQTPELVAQASRGAAVVGDGDDGGERLREQAEGAQGGVEAVSAAERDDLRSLVDHRRGDLREVLGLHLTPSPGRGDAR